MRGLRSRISLRRAPESAYTPLRRSKTSPDLMSTKVRVGAWLPLLIVALIFQQSAFAQDYTCSDPQYEQLFGNHCFEFMDQTNAGVDMTYEDAEALCADKAKTLVTSRTRDELDYLASIMAALKWNNALVGLRYKRANWKWSSNERLLLGQGCHVTTYDEAAERPHEFSPAMSIDKCIDYCTKNRMLYAAVQGGSFCHCSPKFVWQQSASNCSMPCSGTPDQLCGSMLNDLVFATAEMAYDNWLPGRPTVGGGCAAIQIDRELNYWHDASCNMALPFICKFGNFSYYLKYSKL